MLETPARPRTDVTTPADMKGPAPVKLRACVMRPQHEFPAHSHPWHQLAYATEGVLTVTVPGSCLVVPPEQAVWLPAHMLHKIGSPSGAKFKTLYVADSPNLGLGDKHVVVSVTALLRELIVEAVAVGADDACHHDEYAGQIIDLILAQLCRAKKLHSALPWPRSRPLTVLCDALYANPSDCRGLEDIAKAVAMSERTFSRRFEKELGMAFGAWRRRLRLFKAIESLAGGATVTEVALDLGYSSTSAFIHMFRLEMGASPKEFIRAGESRRSM